MRGADVGRGAREDQLAAARAQLAHGVRRARRAPGRRPGRPRRGRRSASARRRPARRRCGARAPARCSSSSEPLRSIWWTTSSSRCSRTARSPGRTTERRDCEVNTIFRLITLCPGPSTTTVSANSLYSCNGSPPLRHLHTARAAARAPAREARRAARRGPLHPRPGGRGLRGASSPTTSARATRSAWPTAPTR